MHEPKYKINKHLRGVTMVMSNMIKIMVIGDSLGSTAPYSPAIRVGSLLFTSGYVGSNPDGSFPPDIKTQTKQTLDKLTKVLERAGVPLENVIKVTVYLRGMKDFAHMNSVYTKYFAEHKPARTTVGVDSLVKDECLVEIELIALCNE